MFRASLYLIISSIKIMFHIIKYLLSIVFWLHLCFVYYPKYGQYRENISTIAGTKTTRRTFIFARVRKISPLYYRCYNYFLRLTAAERRRKKTKEDERRRKKTKEDERR